MAKISEQRRKYLRELLECPTGRLPSEGEIRRMGGHEKLIQRRLRARTELRLAAKPLPRIKGWNKTASPRKPPPPKGRWMYRLWSADDRLLYIGITDRGKTREREHARSKSWWPEVHHVTYQRVHTRAELRFLEAEAIRRERPKYNIQHNN